ncbi:non-ribosomal peptide synthetase/type I polyketide synthase [Desulfoluna butyratoxydans]|uniref:Amp-dependent synthetase/ligase n=1 Tax=Desulfoluna butyratoxydans TaxID=231438 RepID=A0A4U8YXS5_9BACT|nr:non-ribosomal peptide synthetase/type I polyketide synthase [Desulfoluna butyratoxydans]VFQ46273.1 amp-dependent synthetase/ligase [Desulfoluna butyratoxydans]
MQHSEFNEFDIAVIGMACRLPDARDTEMFWHNLEEGRESVKPLEGLPPGEAEPGYVHAGSVLEGIDLFDAEFFGFSPREAALLDPQQRLFLEIAWESLEDAGYDPGRYDGAVGVFAGAGFNHYLTSNLLKGRQPKGGAEGFLLQTSNACDNLATRISYKLNLRGPSLSIQTACSTSLVAVHYACQSLLNSEADMALAGGVALRVPQGVGYTHEKGMIHSEDGHCRPFSHRASGTVFGSGAGAVVLKRLEEAQRDGDTIHAVIKGSAVNNDGGTKVGYTAPSSKGQADVLSSALTFADVPPESVTQIEAHGTGTSLGDPIEFEALNRVYNTGAQGVRCALGAVKGNLGHLENAAGIASLIKMVLSLKHKVLVPSINYERANPHIDFDSSPFYVNTGLKAWIPQGNFPRRGGVSSFGIGGTNCHLILEEYPMGHGAKEDEKVCLFPLSARSREALRVQAEQLAEFVKKRPALSLGDVAGTLAEGRAVFTKRLAVAAGSREALIQALSRSAASPGEVGKTPLEDPDVVFMFPGQGAQYVHMAREVYDREAVFRETLDTCADILVAQGADDPRPILFPGAGDPEAHAARMNRTLHTQPLLFCVEYALAQLWMSWGIRPAAMVGHSVGEYVAACLAGVFSLEDALALIHARASLIDSMPEGSMIAVSAGASDVAPLLPEDLSMAAVNGPGLCVVSGKTAAVSAFRETLEQRGLASSLLHTSHAYHSSMMVPARERFFSVVSQKTCRPPSMPVMSNVSGTLLTEAQATDPAYWAEHITSAVQFSPAVSELTETKDRVFLEVGPGTTLCRLVKSHDHTLNVVSSLPHPEDQTPSDTCLVHAVGELWALGVEVDLGPVTTNRPFTRVPLPTYPFERKRYWIEPLDGGEGALEDVALAGAGTDGGTAPEMCDGSYENEQEEALARLFGRALGIEAPGRYDNFFELGGHSLLATQLLAGINREFQSDIALTDFFKAATIAGLAELLASSGAGASAGELDYPELVREPEKAHEPFPLTEMQQAQWLGRSGAFSMGNVAAHVYLENEKEGIDLKRLEKAWQRMIERHDMLRAVFLPEGGQQILPSPPPYTIANLDLRHETSEEAEQKALEVRSVMDHVVRPVDTWPLFEIRTTQLPGGRVRIHFSIDLLICDVASMRILRKEWAQLYDDPNTVLPELDLRFRDYVMTEKKIRQTSFYKRADAFWDQRVKDLPPMPLLPTAQNIDSISSPTCLRVSTRLDKEAWARFTEWGGGRRLSPSILLLTVFSEVLAAWSKAPDFCVNTTIINRMPVHPQSEEIVGEFASYAPLEVNANRGVSFEALAREIQERNWENLENRFVSGTSVLRKLARFRGGASGSAMPVVFTSTLVHEVEGEDAIETQFGPEVHFISQTPQVWLDHAVFEDGGGVLLSWHYVEGLFPDGMVEAMWSAYEQRLKGLAADESLWSKPVRDLTPEDQLANRRVVNDTRHVLPHGLLHEPFFENARRDPDAVALLFPEGSLTYGRLAGMARRIAGQLLRLGAAPGSLVAVVMDKGWEQVASVLGILAAGCAYLPVSSDLPEERLGYILSNSGATQVLTQPHLLEFLALPETARTMVITEGTLQAMDEAEHVVVENTDQPAYAIYTSGSTGKPKGVLMTHGAAFNTIADINRRFDVTASDRVFALSELHFDLSVYDIFGLLTAGGALVIPGPGRSRDPEHWLSLAKTHGVTIWNSVPALMDMLVTYMSHHTSLPSLRLALLSGDWIPLGLPGKIRVPMPEAELISLGGATEAAIWSIFHPMGEVDETASSIPYGKPLANQWFHVLNSRMGECPVHVPGELFIGGAGLAQGYLNAEALTEKAFVVHPTTKQRLYRTGDMGRYLPDGSIEFLGREDFQVKISGHRIELEEIEAVALRQPGVDAVVAHAPGERDAKKLVAYVVAQPGASISSGGVKEALARALPDYMVPHEVVVLSALPLTANGKVDRNALPEPSTVRGPAVGEEVTDDALTRTLVKTFAEVIGIDASGIDVDENFFSLGGDSIMGIRIVTQLTEGGITVSPQELFEHPTIRQLAACLSRRYAARSGAAALTGPLPLLPAQARCLARYGQAASECNVSVLLRTDSLDPVRAEAAFQHVASLHDVFRIIFVREEGRWIQKYDEAPPLPELDYADITGMAEGEIQQAVAKVERELVEMQVLSESPLMKLCLFEDRTGDSFLLLVAGELIMDLPAVDRFLADFFLAYGAVDEHGHCSEPGPRPVYADRVKALAHGRAGAIPEAGAVESPHWGAVPEGDRSGAEASFVLDGDSMGALPSDILAKARLQPEELLVAALAETLALGGVIREHLYAELLHRPYGAMDSGGARLEACGSFYRVSEMRLPLSHGTPAPERLDAAKHACRGAWESAVGDGDESQRPEVRVCWYGSMQESFDYTRLSVRRLAPQDDGGHALDILAHQEGGALFVTLRGRAGTVASGLLHEIAHALKQALVQLAGAVAESDALLLTPVDFPLAEALDQATLDRVLSEIAAS